MSSKENIASADSLSSKKGKKDKKKKEKKEKKEKNAKTETKQAEKNSAADDNLDKSHEDPQSPQKTKRFGMFRLSGKKSKSEKKNGKHGSRESLKKDGESSSDSVQLKKRVSIGSLDESTSGTEPASGSTESHEESDTRLSDLGESFEVANSPNRKELNEEPEKNDVIVPQERLLKRESVEDKEQVQDTRQDDPDPSVETKVLHEGLVYRVDTSKEEQSTDELSPIPVVLSQTFESEQQSSSLSDKKSKDDLHDENQNPTDTLHMKNEESVNVMKTEGVCKETDEGVVPGSVGVNITHFEDVIKEHDREVTSSEDGSVDTVISTGFCNTEIVTDTIDETKPKDYTINGETNEKKQSENEFAHHKLRDVEELITSTYSDRKTIQMKEEDKEELPPNEETVVLEYLAKQKDESIRETHEEDRVEEPILLTEIKVKKEEMRQVQEEPDMSQITERKEIETQETHEEEPIALKEKNAHTFLEERTVEEICSTEIVTDTVDETKPNDYTINGDTKEKGESENEYALEKPGDVEEIITSTYSDRKKIEIKQDGEEPPPNEETVVLEYVTKRKDESIIETHEEDRVEEPILLTPEIKINSFQEEIRQVQEEPDMSQITERKETKTQETHEEEPIALKEKNAHTFLEERTVVEGVSHVSRISKGVEDETEENGSSVEQEVVTPIRVERKEREMQEKAQKETPVNEGEGMMLINPKKTEQPNWSHFQKEPKSREEPVVLIYSEKQVQSEEDQPTDGPGKDTAQDKDEETDKNNEETSKYEPKEVEEPSGFVVNKQSSFLDQQQNKLLSSTPKIYSHEATTVKPDHNYTARSYIEHNKHVEFVTSIRDLKLSIKLLLAQLNEENKKLRTLQVALNEVLKIGLV